MITFQGRQIPETLPEIINPKHTAIVVHEMLNDFLKPGGIGTENTGGVVDLSSVIPNIVKLLDAGRRKGVRIFYVRFTKYKDYRTWNDPMIARSYKKMMDPNTKISTVEGTWGHQIIDELTPHQGDIVINKFRTDSFFQTNLDLLLRANGIRTFIITGFGAEAGQVPTVTHGVNLGYFAVVPQDCMHPTDIKWYDDAVKMLKDWAIMSNSSEIIKTWSA